MNIFAAAFCIIIALGNFGYADAFAGNFAEKNMSDYSYCGGCGDLTFSEDNENMGTEGFWTENSEYLSDRSRISLMPLSEKETQSKTYFTDGSGLFTEGEQVKISLLLEETAQQTGWRIGICTGTQLENSEMAYKNAFGENSGVMLMINRSGAKVIAVGEAAEYVRGERAENIVRMAERSLRRKNVRSIPSEFCGRVVSCRSRGRGSFDFYPPALIIALVFGAAAGFGTVLFISRRYTLNEPPIVNNYLDVRSIEVYRKEDKLLFSKTVNYQNNIIQQMVRGEGIFRRR